LGLTDRALRTYQLAIRTDSTAAVALLQAGTIYSSRGALEQALRLFELAARVAPALQGVHLAKGGIAYRMGDIEQACREFEEELRHDPGSSAAHINLAMCYEEHLGDLRKAAFHIRKYVELTGGTQELVNHLKELEKRMRDEAE
jgi:tetratricopeptide (TPR) repeat protein